MDAAPLQPVERAPAGEDPGGGWVLSAELADALWRESGAAEWGLERDECAEILALCGLKQNFGREAGAGPATPKEQAEFFRNRKVADLVLAHACARGHEGAWEQFYALHSGALTRAATAISGSETVGRDLAEQFYAELYGLKEREGRRVCPLESYQGRGSLPGWLRTSLAQRFVDHYRSRRREEPLEDDAEPAQAAVTATAAATPMLAEAVREALQSRDAEERLLLASYFLDGRTMAQMAALLGVHEATVSRRIKRATEAVRKQVLKHLKRLGLSGRAAEEALGADPRDVDLGFDLKKLLQFPAGTPFPVRPPTEAAESAREKAGPEGARVTE